jgi:sulfur carrier protein
MTLTFNGELITVEQGALLLNVLKDNDLTDKPGIAVAVNQRIISKSDWVSHVLSPNDAILVIVATKGG